MQALVKSQFKSSQATDPIPHPTPDYPDTVFTWAPCDGSKNPHLLLTIADQQVPIVIPGTRLNVSHQAFAINSWVQMSYKDQALPKYTFNIAEDLIYDVNADTFVVAAPFDVKKGRTQVAGVSEVGSNATSVPGVTPGNDSSYSIKFSYLASPLAKQQEIRPTGGVQRIESGQLDNSGRGYAAFTELVARLYFNVVTAALGNTCNPGCASAPFI